MGPETKERTRWGRRRRRDRGARGHQGPLALGREAASCPCAFPLAPGPFMTLRHGGFIGACRWPARPRGSRRRMARRSASVDPFETGNRVTEAVGTRTVPAATVQPYPFSNTVKKDCAGLGRPWVEMSRCGGAATSPRDGLELNRVSLGRREMKFSPCVGAGVLGPFFRVCHTGSK